MTTYNVTKNGMPPYSTTSDAAEAIADCEEANRTVCPGHEIYRESDGAYMVEGPDGGLCEYRATWLPPPSPTHSPVPSPVGAWARVTNGDTTMKVNDIMQGFRVNGWQVDATIGIDGRFRLEHTGLQDDEEKRVAILRSLASQAEELGAADSDIRNAIKRRHGHILERACQGTVRRWRHVCDETIVDNCHRVYQRGATLGVIIGITQDEANVSWRELMDALTGIDRSRADEHL